MHEPGYGGQYLRPWLLGQFRCRNDRQVKVFRQLTYSFLTHITFSLSFSHACLCHDLCRLLCDRPKHDTNHKTDRCLTKRGAINVSSSFRAQFCSVTKNLRIHWAQWGLFDILGERGGEIKSSLPATRAIEDFWKLSLNLMLQQPASSRIVSTAINQCQAHDDGPSKLPTSSLSLKIAVLVETSGLLPDQKALEK